jgi:hypothetical protein
MLTIYFCYDGRDPIIRCWPSIPRVGDTVALPELESEGDSFTVVDVLWQGDDEPTLSIYLKRSESFLRRIINLKNTSTPCSRGGSS